MALLNKDDIFFLNLMLFLISTYLDFILKIAIKQIAFIYGVHNFYKFQFFNVKIYTL